MTDLNNKTLKELEVIAKKDATTYKAACKFAKSAREVAEAANAVAESAREMAYLSAKAVQKAIKNS